MRFTEVPWRAARSGAPILDGVLAWIDCELHAGYDGGDHMIAVGDVRGLSAGDAGQPLLYYRGAYAGVRPVTSVRVEPV